MKLTDKIQVFKLEEDLHDLLLSVANDQTDGVDDEKLLSVYTDMVAKIFHKGLDAQLTFLHEAGWTEKQIEAHLFDEDLTLEEEMKCHTTQR